VRGHDGAHRRERVEELGLPVPGQTHAGMRRRENGRNRGDGVLGKGDTYKRNGECGEVKAQTHLPR
jgi:hypothetical protein